MKVVVCGGGNAAHALVPAIKKASGCWVGVLAPYGDEAVRISQGTSEGGIIASFADGDVRGVPDVVTAVPAEVVPLADAVILALPAFAHKAMIDAILPYLKEGAWLGGMPSRSGFEFHAGIPDFGRKGTVLFGFQTLPWACRIAQYGRRVIVLGQKASVGLGSCPSGKTQEVARTLGAIIGVKVKPLRSMMAVTLGNVGQIVHPGIMYGLFKGREEQEYDEALVPLFYQGVTDDIARVLERMSGEVLDVSAEISRRSRGRLDLAEVVGLRQWLLDSYCADITDKSSLKTCFTTNSAYRGLKAPVMKCGSKYRADFGCRYLTEDVPFGLIVTKGVAELCGVPTPAIDAVVETTSSWMGVEYYVQDRPEGKDIGESRHPRNFGIAALDRLIEINS